MRAPGWNKTVGKGRRERGRDGASGPGDGSSVASGGGGGRGMSGNGVRGEGANLMGFGLDRPRHESHWRVLAKKKFNHKKLALAAALRMTSRGAASQTAVPLGMCSKCRVRRGRSAFRCCCCWSLDLTCQEWGQGQRQRELRVYSKSPAEGCSSLDQVGAGEVAGPVRLRIRLQADVGELAEGLNAGEKAERRTPRRVTGAQGGQDRACSGGPAGRPPPAVPPPPPAVLLPA